MSYANKISLNLLEEKCAKNIIDPILNSPKHANVVNLIDILPRGQSNPQITVSTIEFPERTMPRRCVSSQHSGLFARRLAHFPFAGENPRISK
jgi:hypothetical protein